MMKIGIDVDGVLIDFEERFRCQAELYDYKERKNTKIKANDSYWIEEKYGWDEETWKAFSNKYLLKLTEESNFMIGAKDVLQLLDQDIIF